MYRQHTGTCKERTRWSLGTGLHLRSVTVRIRLRFCHQRQKRLCGDNDGPRARRSCTKTYHIASGIAHSALSQPPSSATTSGKEKTPEQCITTPSPSISHNSSRYPSQRSSQRSPGKGYETDEATWGSNFWVTLVDPQVRPWPRSLIMS